MLLASRVKDWLKPLLYRTLVVPYEPIDGYPDLRYNMDSFLSSIRADPEFFCDSIPIDMSTFEPSTLKRLSLYHIPVLSPPSVLSQLTHLDLASATNVAGESEVLTFCSALPLLPRLTHLCLSGKHLEPFFLQILHDCPSLVVLLYISRPPDGYLGLCPDLASLVNDPRFVVCHQDSIGLWSSVVDWQNGVHFGQDFWFYAQVFILKRCSGVYHLWRYVMQAEDWYNEEPAWGLVPVFFNLGLS
ncbi:hypothetical protein FB45DRAFT_1062550 [Roridomyces roridus]|uniref:Uncharacterized protein n=1 Tax=Roridomyces roridus TaxID=1738132 RepID=A0AAD7BGE2_9AGAR|nr:hypothetical protein FB45DRAFT_1062550 [Roridomyces roridus]